MSFSFAQAQSGTGVGNAGTDAGVGLNNSQLGNHADGTGLGSSHVETHSGKLLPPKDNMGNNGVTSLPPKSDEIDTSTQDIRKNQHQNLRNTETQDLRNADKPKSNQRLSSGNSSIERDIERD